MVKAALINDTRNAQHMGCRLVIRNLDQILKAEDIRVSWRWPTGRDWREAGKRLKDAGGADVVLVNAEGSIHDDGGHKLAERFAAVPKWFRKELGIPCVLLNATICRNSKALYELIDHYDLVYVRDSGSAKELAEHGISATIISDLTLAQKPPYRLGQGDRKGILATDSAIPAVASELQYFAMRNGWEFTPMEFSRYPHSNKLKRPRIYLRKVRNYLKDLLVYRPTLKKYLGHLASSSLVVTGRYHTVTMCLLTGTPFVALESNTPKISWLLEDAFGTTNRLLDSLKDVDPEVLVNMSKWTEVEESKLKKYLQNARKHNAVMGGKIRELATSAHQMRNR